MKQEIKLGDTVKVLEGQFKYETGIVVGINTYDKDFDDPYYEVEMQCEVPDKYKCRKTLIGDNNVIGGLSADELEVLYSAKSQQQRLIPKDYLKQILDLQDKYTTLQCECMRFADWVLNMSHDRCAIAIKFDNEYLDMAARELAANLRSKTAEEKESERKAFNDKVKKTFDNSIRKDL